MDRDPLKPFRHALLLAAGLGTRLRPLTLTTPKPLLPLNGELLIDHQLYYLAAAGIEEVAINLHHLGHLIRKHVGDGRRYGLTVAYSEEPEILGTGGAIQKARPLAGTGAFLVLNADALLDADLAAVMDAHRASGAEATMVVKPLEPNDAFTPIAVDAHRQVSGFGTGRHYYTGLQILTPSIFEVLPPAGTEACLIRDGYQRLLERGAAIHAYEHQGYANDLGTPASYAQARADIVCGRFRLCGKPPSTSS
jgi:NDP-sugar pyrophosphorylase family protein